MVFVLLMSNTLLFLIIICSTYFGREMDPSPYLLIFWQVVLAPAVNIADTDL